MSLSVSLTHRTFEVGGNKNIGLGQSWANHLTGGPHVTGGLEK